MRPKRIQLQRIFRQAGSTEVLICLAIAGICLCVWRWKIIAYAAEFNFLGTGDLFSYFFPMLEAGYSHLRAGRLFLWNPNQMNGMPGLATLQAGFLYPPHLVYLVVPTAFGMGLMAFSHTVFSGWGMLLFLRMRGLAWPAAFAGACYFCLTTILALVHWQPGMEAASWLPLGVTALERFLLARDRRWALVFIASVAMPILAGGYQTAIAVYGCYGLWTGAILVRHTIATRSLRFALVRGAMASLVLGIGLTFAAPQILPTLELSGFTERSSSALTVQQVLPFGNADGNLANVFSKMFDPAPKWIRVYTFIGVVTLGLAMLGVFRQRLESIPLLILTLFGILSVAAPDWFLAFRSHVPVLNWFRVPTREFFLAKFALAVLAAYGIQGLIEWRPPKWVALWVLPLGLAWVSGLFWMAGAQRNYIGVVAASFALLVLARLFLSRRAWGTGIVGLSVALFGYDTLAAPVNDQALPYAHARWHDFYSDADIYRTIASVDRYARSLVIGSRWTLKLPMLTGTFSPIDYDPMVISYFHDCMCQAKGSSTSVCSGDRLMFLGAPPDLTELLVPPMRRCLDLAAVSLAAVPQMTLLNRQILDSWAETGIQLPVRTGVKAFPPFDSKLLRNPNSLSRVYGVYETECRSPRMAELQRALEPGFDARQSVVLEAGRNCQTLQSPGRGTTHPKAEILRFEDTFVEIGVDFAAHGFLVLTDSYYPGWRATVDGSPVPILRANGMFRAVPVPAGRSTVTFRYVPYSLYVGCCVLVVGMIATVLSWRWLRPASS